MEMMQALKILIIEDEAAAVVRLKKLLEEIEPEARILAEIDTVAAAVRWFRDHPQPDLTFMDIHLADGQSFGIFGEAEVRSPVIFTTAFDQYAIKAFEVNSIDYLLKPIRREDLQRALEKYHRLYARSGEIAVDYDKLASALLAPQKENYADRFLVEFGQQMKVLPVAEVAYFHLQNGVAFVRSRDGKRYALGETLDSLEARLHPRRFFRLNRQFIASIEAITGMHAWSRSRIKILLEPDPGMEVIVSTERSPQFRAWLSGIA